MTDDDIQTEILDEPVQEPEDVTDDEPVHAIIQAEPAGSGAGGQEP